MPLRTVVLHIAQNASLSSDIFVSSAIVAITVPSSWTPAVMSFQSNYANAGFYDVYNSIGNELSLPIDPGTTAGVKPDYLGGGFSVRLRSGLDGFEVAQTAAGGVNITLTLEG